MATDSEIIEQLLTALEESLIDRHILSILLVTYAAIFPIGDWKADMERMKKGQNAQDVRERFFQLRRAGVL